MTHCTAHIQGPLFQTSLTDYYIQCQVLQFVLLHSLIIGTVLY